MNMHKSGLAFVAFFIVLALVVSAARQNGWGYPGIFLAIMLALAAAAITPLLFKLFKGRMSERGISLREAGKALAGVIDVEDPASLREASSAAQTRAVVPFASQGAASSGYGNQFRGRDDEDEDEEDDETDGEQDGYQQGGSRRTGGYGSYPAGAASYSAAEAQERALSTMGARFPSQLRQEHQYRLHLGSHTLDFDTILDHLLILEALPEGAKGVTRILGEELGGKLRVPYLLVDFTDGFQSLLSELPKGYLISSPERHNELPAQLRSRSVPLARSQQAIKLGRALLHEGGQAVFRFASYSSPIEACSVLLLILQGMYHWEREHVEQGNHPMPCVILLNQAHRFLPYRDAYSVANADPSLARLLSGNLLHYLAMHGEFGMYFYLVTDQATRMNPAALQELGLWLIKQPQLDELRYLSEIVALDLSQAIHEMFADQVLLFDIVGRTSFPVTLRMSRSALETDTVLLPISYTLAQASELTAPGLLPETSLHAAAPGFGQSVAAHQSRTDAMPRTDELSDEESASSAGPGGFSEAWLAYASYLYATGRLTPTALRRIPDPLFDLAAALGLNPVRGQDAMNGKRAIRLVGIVQGMGKDKRGKYTRLARQYAPTLPQSTLGGVSSLGPSPPGRAGEVSWVLPRLELLKRSQKVAAITKQELSETAQLISRLLAEYDVHVNIRPEECKIGQTITRYAGRPGGKPKLRRNATTGHMEGVRGPGGLLLYEKMTTVDQIEAREKDLATKLAVDSVRIARVPGKPFVGIEIPHPEEKRMPVRLRDIVGSQAYQQALVRSKVLFPIGMDVAGEVRFVDLSNPDHPHLLVAGVSGGGKSVFLRAGISSIALQATPEEVRMWLVDPKRVDFKPFVGLPHLIESIVTEVDAIPSVVSDALAEVQRRYTYFERLSVTDLGEYRQLRAKRSESGDTSLKNLPELLLIIDELGDALMVSPQEVEEDLCHLGQLGRAAGLHLIVATQRPEVKIVTGRIKANLPYRVALHVSSTEDSKVIIGRGGAQMLLGHGDMLAGTSGRLERLQGALVEKDEAESVVARWRQQATRLQPTSPFIIEQSQSGEPLDQSDEASLQEGHEEEGEALLQRVISELPQKRKVSINEIKEEYNVSHQTAKPIVDQLKARGLIGDYNASLKGYPVRVINLKPRTERGQDRDNGEEEERSQTS